MLQPGSRLGKYRLIRPIGTGGFATVYLGEHVYLGTKAAVKVLHLGADMKQESIEKFLQEARTIAVLKHAHIVSILDFGVEDGGIPCLIMDYAPNGALSARHKKEAILDNETVLSYTMQVAEALQFAHDRRVVHCDIKPENMLLDENNNVLLSDFGIAVVMHTSFRMSTVMGTVHYMPPEQFAGQPVAASDQYALAITIYRWLCGQFPFNSSNIPEMWHLQTNVPPPPPRRINPQISREVEQVILTALAKDPRQRFNSISTFASALGKAMQPKRIIPPTLSMSSFPILPMEKTEVAADDPLVFLPSLTSVLPSADEDDIRVQPSPVLPALSQSMEDVHKPLVSQAYDAHQEAVPWWNEIVGMLDDGAKLPPKDSLQPSTTCLIYNQHTAWVSAVAWSPDGRRLASASWDKTVHIWDAASGKTLLVYRGHAQPVKSVAWSPNGDYAASGGWDNSVQVWDTAKGTALPKISQRGVQIEAVAWSPDGVYIATAGDDTRVRVWRVSDQYPFFVYDGHKGPVWSIAWSPDGESIASASHDGTVQVWKALTGKRVQVYRDHNRQVETVSWSYDGQFIASGDRNGWVHIWSYADGKMLLQYRDAAGAVKALNWSPRSMRLASAVKSVQVWHLTTTLPTAPSFTYTGHTDWINALHWSPNGQRIATASDDKTVRVWEVC